MESNILKFLNMDFDVFMIGTCVVMAVLLIALFFLLLDYLRLRKRYMEFHDGREWKISWSTRSTSVFVRLTN